MKKLLIIFLLWSCSPALHQTKEKATDSEKIKVVMLFAVGGVIGFTLLFHEE